MILIDDLTLVLMVSVSVQGDNWFDDVQLAL